MPEEREPNLEAMIAALKTAIENFDQEPDSGEMPGKQTLILSRDTMELIPNRPPHLLKDLMTGWRDLEKLWQQANTPEKKTAIRQRIKQALEIALRSIERTK